MKLNIEELKAMIKADSKSDRTELGKDSLEAPYLYGKYLAMYEDELIKLKRKKNKFKIVQRQTWEYYTGKAPAKVYKEKPFHLKLLKADVALYVQSDPTYQKIEDEIFEQELIVNLLKGATDIMTKKMCGIKGALDDIKWKQGIV